MSLIMERIGVVYTNATNLCTLLNVADEKHFLQQCMSPEAFQECIQGGDTNMAKVQVLCVQIVKELADGNTKMYDALCEYFLKRSEAYQSMHQCFIANVSNHTNDGATSSNDANSELLLLQEKVKDLTVELLHCHQSHSSTDSQAELIAIKELLVEMKRELLGKWFTQLENEDQKSPQCQPISVDPSSLGPMELLQFTFEGLSPVEARADGSYSPFHWQEKHWLGRWKEMLQEENSSLKLALPPLLWNVETVAKVPIVIYGQRWKDEIAMYGGFPNNVSASVSALNVQLELSLTFTKKDNSKVPITKQIIVTVGHGTGWLFEKRICTLYNVPFTSLSSSYGPAATNISIKPISPEQKWFYWGLAPRLSRDGKFDTIYCYALNGTTDCALEWKKIVEGTLGFISLPPLMLPSEILNDAAVCVYGERKGNELHFRAKFHPSTPDNVKSCEMLVKIVFHVTLNTNASITRHGGNIVTMQRDRTNVASYTDLPWCNMASWDAPRLNLFILPA